MFHTAIYETLSRAVRKRRDGIAGFCFPANVIEWRSLKYELKDRLGYLGRLGGYANTTKATCRSYDQVFAARANCCARREFKLQIRISG
jgi:hypothetical protein